MIVKTVVVGPLEVNCYILGCEDTKEAAIIDPGGDDFKIIKAVEGEGLVPKYIINTHAHFDHVGAVKSIKEYFKIDFLLHEEDSFLIDSVEEQAATFGMGRVPKPEINKSVNDGDKIPLGQNIIQVIHTPGHTPGGVCYYVDNCLYAGDTLFAGSIGRTDFPFSSHEMLIKSIKEKLFSLDDGVIVYTGHGPSTTIGNEKTHNPFLT